MKKIIAIILCVLLVCGLCGWKKIDSEDMDVFSNIIVIVDEETGVEYIVFSGYNRGGICPRYNANGTLRVREE